MTKYEIKTDAFEFRMGYGRIPAMSGDEIYDTYMSGGFLNPKTECSFDTLDEAKAAFAEKFSGYGHTELVRGSAGYLLIGRMAWIEENEYDDDGEFDHGGDIWQFSAAPYDPEVSDDDDDED